MSIIIRSLLLGLSLSTLYAGSLVILPIEKVDIVGLKHLTQKEVVTQTGLEVNKPWLWAWSYRLKTLSNNPWVQKVTLEKPALGKIRLVVVERTSVATYIKSGQMYGVAKDGTFLPDAPKQLPIIEGTLPLPLAQVQSLLLAFPGAEHIAYNPAGFTVNWKSKRLWSATAAGLVKISGGEKTKAGKEVYAYAWGVSRH